MAFQSLTHLCVRCGWNRSGRPISLTQHPETVNSPQGRRRAAGVAARGLVGWGRIINCGVGTGIGVLSLMTWDRIGRQEIGLTATTLT